MKKSYITARLILAVGVSSKVNGQTSSNDDLYVSMSGGLGFADVSEYAAAVAQLSAAALDKTVYYSYDRATWAGKGCFRFEFTDNIDLAT